MSKLSILRLIVIMAAACQFRPCFERLFIDDSFDRARLKYLCASGSLKLVSIAILTLIGLHQNTHRLDWYSPRRVLSTNSAIKPVRPVSQPFRRVGNQTAVLSKLRFQVPNPSAKVRHKVSPLLLCFRRSLQLRNARLNIFNLDGLGCVRHYAIGGPHFGGCWRTRVHHHL